MYSNVAPGTFRKPQMIDNKSFEAFTLLAMSAICPHFQKPVKIKFLLVQTNTIAIY